MIEKEDNHALKGRQGSGDHHRRPFPTSTGSIIFPTGTPPGDPRIWRNPPPVPWHPPTDKFGPRAMEANIRDGHGNVPGFGHAGPTGTGFSTVTRTGTGPVEPTWQFPTIPPDN